MVSAFPESNRVYFKCPFEMHVMRGLVYTPEHMNCRRFSFLSSSWCSLSKATFWEGHGLHPSNIFLHYLKFNICCRFGQQKVVLLWGISADVHTVEERWGGGIEIAVPSRIQMDCTRTTTTITCKQENQYGNASDFQEMPQNGVLMHTHTHNHSKPFLSAC